MKMRKRSFFPVPAFFVLLSSLSAQTTARVCPDYVEHFEGRGGDRYLAGWEDMHEQVLYDGARIARTRAVITAVAFRRDCDRNKPFQARKVHRRILADHCAGTPDAISGTFARNLGPGAVKVFESSRVVFPPQPACAAGPAPFAAVFPFSKPFLYERKKGNLLLDILGKGTPSAWREWIADAHAQSYGTSGMTAPLGPGCKGKAGEYVHLSVSPYPLKLGGSLSLSFTTNLAKPGTLLAWVGARCNRLGNTPLPLDLTFLGATGCKLYTSLEVLFVLQGSGSGYPGLSLPIPGNPALAMAQVFTQAAAYAPGANPAGLLFTGGVRCLVWPGRRPPTVLNSVFTNSSAASRGSIMRTPVGPVTQFRGTFQ